MFEFKLPDVGEGLTEAEILEWKVKPGDTIKVNDVLVDIETAKSIVELPSPQAGIVGELLVPAGEIVPVGTPIIRFAGPSAPESRMPAGESPETAGESRMPAGESPETIGESRMPAGESPETTGEKHEPVLVGYGPRAGSLKRRPRKSAPKPPKPSEPTETSEPLPAPAFATASLRVLAKPPVRKLAKDLGVDLAALAHAGDIITRAAVESSAALRQRDRGSSPTEVVSPRAGEGDTRVPVRGVRKMTAEAMVSSAFTAPHVTEWVTIDVTKMMGLVRTLKADRAFADVKVSPLLIVAKAVCLALRKTPELNATWDDAAQEIVLKKAVNLGIAAATPRGLVVPNVQDASSLPLIDLARALGELVSVARVGRTQPADMSGGTFTITNVGTFGVDAGTPILNPGESGILCLGQIARRPWVDTDGETIVARDVMTLALSFDHRIVDGEQGSRFLADVAALLSDPSMAMTY